MKRCLLLGRKAMTNLDNVLKSRRHHFANRSLYSQTCGFPSSHVQMWELDNKEGCALKNRCFRIAMLEKTIESSLDCRKIKPVNSKGSQSWIFIGRTDAEAEALILWPPEVRSPTHWKRPWCSEILRTREGAAEGEMVGWPHWLNGYEFEQTPGNSEGQGGLACCNPWGGKESNTTYQLNYKQLL